MEFNPKDYWEERLSGDYSFRGVGDITLGVNYNNYIYKLRTYVINRLIRKSRIDIAGKRMIDIGPGTGFYVEQFKQHGCTDLCGIDITQKVVSELGNRYPAFRFYQADIGSADFTPPESGFDIASSFDVLYHIVEDRKFENAIKNISAMIKPGGIFLYSDYFLPPGKRYEITHMVCRDMNYVQDVLKSNDFTIEKKTPMFVLMNTSFSRNFFMKRFFDLVSRFIRKGETYGKIAGACLYPFEVGLVSTLSHSRSTEILVCRKKG